MVDVKLKNAHKRVHDIFLNGLRQRRSYDFTLTSKGIKFIPSLQCETGDTPYFITVITEETFVIK